MDSMIYWIWLSLACTPGGPTFGKLIKEFDGPKEIFEADGKKIASIIGYRTSDRTNLENKKLDRAEEVYRFCKKFNVGIVTYGDDEFPDALRKINDPPVLLYYRGRFPDFNRIFPIGAVGTRSLSEYGRKHAFRISHDLAKGGATIVSGMAIGIDGVSMAGALSAGGVTVAVIGSGIDVCYPSQHLRLAREIVKRGCVITEYAPGTKPGKYNFPKRNRLISGLSEATVVFEGAEKSGALITARYAKEQGKPVYALPGNVGSKNSELSNLLIKNGAKICTKAEDLLNDFAKSHPDVVNTFNLSDRMGVDMMEALREYEVCAVCPNDDVFYIPKPWKRREETSALVQEESEAPAKEEAHLPTSFDPKAFKVYKKIPAEGSCSIESLVDEEMNLRDIMRHLLTLEVGGFVRLLPGETVTRKFK
ncbi:MAG: DNA-processing protein DprA [Clostridia bacterium]|nr:DNA-processing protein DprA [Clostridia bacterium]